MKKFLEEFKAFALKGNVVDLAIGVVIGGAFNKIVSSLVQDVIMPLFSVFTKDQKFVDYKIFITDSAAINIGVFIQNIIDFLIISFSIFVAIKVISKLNRKNNSEEESVTEDPEDVVLLKEIRDLLKEKSK